MNVLNHHLAVATLACAACFGVTAQEVYPSRPVTIVVPFPPAGFADNAMRLLQPSLERSLKQSTVIQNKPGAGGAIGVTSALQAKPDGYNILFMLSAVATLPGQAEINNQKPPFALDHLLPVARMTSDPVALIVKADSPYKTVAELIAAAKAKPNNLTFASSGNYGASHVPAAMFNDAANIKVTHVPYSGGGPMITALLGSQVDFAVLARSLALPQVQAGKLRFLASFGQTRWPKNPETPSLAEYGLNVDYVPWTGVFVSSSTSPEVVSTLRNALRAASSDPQFREGVDKAGVSSSYLEGAELQTFWRNEIQSVNAAVRKIGKLE